MLTLVDSVERYVPTVLVLCTFTEFLPRMNQEASRVIDTFLSFLFCSCFGYYLMSFGYADSPSQKYSRAEHMR